MTQILDKWRVRAEVAFTHSGQDEVLTKDLQACVARQAAGFLLLLPFLRPLLAVGSSDGCLVFSVWWTRKTIISLACLILGGKLMGSQRKGKLVVEVRGDGSSKVETERERGLPRRLSGTDSETVIARYRVLWGEEITGKDVEEDASKISVPDRGKHGGEDDKHVL